MNRLFQPFQQVEQFSKTISNGTGLGQSQLCNGVLDPCTLGLAVCKSLAEALGGAVWARSEVISTWILVHTLFRLAPDLNFFSPFPQIFMLLRNQFRIWFSVCMSTCLTVRELVHLNTQCRTMSRAQLWVRFWQHFSVQRFCGKPAVSLTRKRGVPLLLFLKDISLSLLPCALVIITINK